MSTTVTAKTSSGVARLDLVVLQGATYTVEFTWLVDGVAQRLAGTRAVMAFAVRPGREPDVSVSSLSGEITLEPEGHAGVIKAVVPAEKTALLTSSRRPYAYDLIVIRGDEVHRVVEGEALVRPAVARAD